MSYVQPAAAGRRSVGFIVVVVFHAVLFYALANGLGRKVVEVLKEPLEAKIIEEIKPPPEDKPPPPPQPQTKAAPPPVFAPKVEVQVQAQPQENTITSTTNVKPAETAPMGAKTAPAAPPAPAAPAAPAKTSAVIKASSCEKPAYPAASLRAEETGTVRLSFLINAEGVVIDSKVDRSSGSRRLDEAARKALALCHFKPGTVDGKPVQSWEKLEYEWKLDE